MTTSAQIISRCTQLLVDVRDSIFRTGLRPISDRERSHATFHNLFLHIQSVRTHKNSLRFAYSFGLGVILTVCFILLTVSGILLMIYYKPSTALAYDSIKDIHFVVPTGRFMRNLHRWAAHVMVVAVFLHMARVFYTGAYKKPREFNWLVGLALLALTLGLSFTGYLLPWDQLAYWATTIGANIAHSPRELTDSLGMTALFDPGGLMKRLLLGANQVGQEALIRFYVLHVAVLPLAMTLLMGVHFWRIRKDGGLSRDEDRPTEPAEIAGREAERVSAESDQDLRVDGDREGPKERRREGPRRYGPELAAPVVGRSGAVHVDDRLQPWRWPISSTLPCGSRPIPRCPRIPPRRRGISWACRSWFRTRPSWAGWESRRSYSSASALFLTSTAAPRAWASGSADREAAPFSGSPSHSD